jgi:hypothetical protein
MIILLTVADLLGWKVLHGDSFYPGPYGPGFRYLYFKTPRHNINVVFSPKSCEVTEIAVEPDTGYLVNLWVHPDFQQLFQQLRHPQMLDEYASIFHIKTEQEALALLAEVGS